MRIEMSGQAAAVVQAGSIEGGVHVHARHAAPSPARPITEWHPFDLDVHRAVTVGTTDLPDLPAYLPRDHDRALADLLSAKSTVMAVLTGESSTGKTRALYEAVTTELPTWPLLYPRTAEDLLHVLAAGVEPGTVLWLNETQNHLTGSHGEQAAAALRTLLELPGPYVVLGTLWPRYWSALTGTDHPQVRNLLQHRATRIRLADRFDPAQMAARTTDPRLRKALATAHDRKVIQTIAGGPALVECYEHPDTPEDRFATAIVTAALDARRLGHQALLPTDLLTAAAPGYLHEDDRVGAPATWFEVGLGIAASNRMGVAALIPKRRSPGIGPPDGYDIHDYLDQHGRATRHWARTPDSLWDAVVAHTTDPQDRLRLARNAYHRLRYRHADPLYRTAATTAEPRHELLDVLIQHGRLAELEDLVIENPPALDSVLRILERDPNPYRLAVRALLAHQNPEKFGELLVADLLESGQVDEAVDVLRRWIDAGVDAYEWLADLLADRGRWDEALAVVRSDTRRWTKSWLAERLSRAGNVAQLRRLAEAGSVDADEYLARVVPYEQEQRQPLDELTLLSSLGEDMPFGHRLVRVLTTKLVAQGRHAAAVEALRLVLARVDPIDERHVTEALADALAAGGRWAEALELAKAAPWEGEWVAEQLAKAGNLAVLRKLADTGLSHAGRELAALLAARGRYDELLDRTRKGDEHCAQQLVALAHGGKLPNGERLLAEGL
ncbi:hypothetical protein GCM10027184_36060 [Saccharothrix stipae]